MKNFSYRKLVLLIADIVIIVFSGVFLNYVLSLVGWIGPESSRGLLYYIILNVITCVLLLLASGAYARLWRFFNIRDYIFCELAVVFGFALSFSARARRAG